MLYYSTKEAVMANKSNCRNCNSEFEHKGWQAKYCPKCALTTHSQRRRQYMTYAGPYTRAKERAGCQLCGYKNCSKALEFHHVRSKSFPINANSIRCMSYGKLMEEITKCALVCSNCHREIHQGLLPVPDKKTPEWVVEFLDQCDKPSPHMGAP